MEIERTADFRSPKLPAKGNGNHEQLKLIADWLAEMSTTDHSDDRAHAVSAMNLFCVVLKNAEPSDQAAVEEVFRSIAAPHGTLKITPWNGDPSDVTRWLAQKLATSKDKHSIRAAQLLMERLLDPWTGGKRWKDLSDSDRAIRRAADSSLVWLVLHAPSGSKTLDTPVSWATRLLEQQVIRPMIRRAWGSFCFGPHRSDKDFYQFLGELGFDFPEFAKHAIAHVWIKLPKYKEMDGKLRPWVRKVLHRHLEELEKNWLRRHRRQQTLPDREQSTEDKWKVPNGQSPEQDRRRRPQSDKARKAEELKIACVLAASEAEPLTAFDIDILRTWKAVDGIIVGCDTDLYRRIPVILWKKWCREFQLKEMPNFEMTKLHPFKRREHLAQALGMSRDNVDQRWKRIIPQVTKLQCILKFLGTT